jgi:hypothetical protein
MASKAKPTFISVTPKKTIKGAIAASKAHVKKGNSK